MIINRAKKGIKYIRIMGLDAAFRAMMHDFCPNLDPRRHQLREHIYLSNNLENQNRLVGAEIGVGSGYHAELLLNQLEFETLYLIDPYEEYDEYNKPITREYGHLSMEDIEQRARDRLSNYQNIEWLKKESFDAVNDINTPLDYVYIDGNHQYEFVKQDIELYYDLVRPGGIVAGHDFTYSWPGVIRAVVDFAHDRNINFYTETQGNDWYIIKQE